MSTIAIAQPVSTSLTLSSRSAEFNSQISQVENTDAQLQAFYQAQGGQSQFPDHYVSAIEALLRAQDELAAGEREAAKQRVDSVFAEMPLSAPIWTQDATLFDLNVGNPIAYYGLRMLDQILQMEPVSSEQNLTMTAVVPLCAEVTRPTLPDLEPETLQRTIDNRILANDAEVLYQSTDLFRRWLSAIANGLNIELNVQVVEQCATVDFELTPNVIISYPDTNSLIASVPFDVIANTDVWWVVVPSGVPGDGGDFDKTFITGGMGLSDTGVPVFLSDDGWFLRKPAHLGKGDYSEVERRLYMPQWFQHEFMHHLFRVFPELELEVASHQWFDRSTWPDDFVGRYEPDYYAEALQRRLLDAEPTIEERVANRPQFADFRTFSLAKIAGKFERQPVENDFHEVTVKIDDALSAMWTNKADFSWRLIIVEHELRSASDSIYGERRLFAELDANSNVTALVFLGERYVRIDTPPEGVEDQDQCFVVRAKNGNVTNFCL